ncbi:MAG: NAD-dependent epimerase/dehydratase family protein [Bacteroidales bacterium]|jgi:nucleoside-diphosphate-sugar epimerase|nr:NAD-dependent epimerase/dehydratase family protein [Bacteroidales bacterium]
MNILVTGATGFLGGWVLSKLCDEFGRDRVVGTGRSRERGDELTRKGFKVLIGDLTDPGFIENNLQNFTHIIHCAAKSSLWGSYDSFYKNNVVSTKNLLQGIHGIQKFIYISTPSIYFRFSDRIQIKEDSALPEKFVNHYTSTKYLAEQEVLSFNSRKIVKVILRPRAIIGAGDTVIVPRVIRAFKAGKLRIIGDGKNICDFTSVKNIAHAVYLAVASENDIDGEIFNITDDNPKAIWEMVEETLKKLGYQPNLKKINYRLVFAIASISELTHKIFNLGEPVLTRYGVGLLRYTQTFDITSAKQILKYKPVITTEESIDEFIKSFQGEQ